MATVEARRKSSRLKNTRRGVKKKTFREGGRKATYVPKDLSVRKPCRKLLFGAGKCGKKASVSIYISKIPLRRVFLYLLQKCIITDASN